LVVNVKFLMNMRFLLDGIVMVVVFALFAELVPTVELIILSSRAVPVGFEPFQNYHILNLYLIQLGPLDKLVPTSS